MSADDEVLERLDEVARRIREVADLDASRVPVMVVKHDEFNALARAAGPRLEAGMPFPKLMVRGVQVLPETVIYGVWRVSRWHELCDGNLPAEGQLAVFWSPPCVKLLRRRGDEFKAHGASTVYTMAAVRETFVAWLAVDGPFEHRQVLDVTRGE